MAAPAAVHPGRHVAHVHPTRRAREPDPGVRHQLRPLREEAECPLPHRRLREDPVPWLPSPPPPGLAGNRACAPERSLPRLDHGPVGQLREPDTRHEGGYRTPTGQPLSAARVAILPQVREPTGHTLAVAVPRQVQQVETSPAPRGAGPPRLTSRVCGAGSGVRTRGATHSPSGRWGPPPPRGRG